MGVFLGVSGVVQSSAAFTVTAPPGRCSCNAFYSHHVNFSRLPDRYCGLFFIASAEPSVQSSA